MEAGKRYKKGHFIEMGLAAGIPVGIPVGLAIGNIALGPLLGVVIGLGTGFLIERIFNKNPVEPTEKGKIVINKFSFTGIIIGLALFLTVLVIYLFVKLYQI